mgnify:CR=1 FL=1
MPIRPTAKGQRIYRTKILPKLKKKVNRLYNQIEKKHKDFNFNPYFASDSGVSVACYLDEGDSSSQRTGLKVYGKSLEVRGQVLWSKSTSQETACRLLVVLDKNANGAVPAITKILESQTVNSLYDNTNMGTRFVILKDKLFSNLNPSTTVNKDQAYKFKVKINRNMHFLDGGVTSSSLGRNMIYVLCISDVSSASALGPTSLIRARLTYDDL